MKIKLTLTIYIFLNSFISNGQNAYYDALFLKGALSVPNLNTGKIALNNKVKDLLANYFGPLPTFADQSAIDRFFVTNPFFQTPQNSSVSIFISAGAMFVLPYNNIMPSVGNLDVTNLADGFAKFLVKRTKEELSSAFFDRFNTFISSDKFKDARILFPQTYTTLQAIGSEVYNYQAYINSLRESFEKDMDGLLSNLPNVINDASHAAFFLANPDLKAICLSSIYIGNGLLNKQHPGQIIADYNINTLNNISNKNVTAAVQILQLFSGSLRSASADHYWIPRDSLEMLIKDDIAFKIYLGLISQKANNILFKDGSNFQQVLYNNENNFQQYDSYIRNFIKQASIVVTNVKNVSGKQNDKLTFTDYYNLYNSALDLIKTASDTYLLPGLSTLKPSDDFIKYQNIASLGGNIALDINRKNYSSAIMNAFSLYVYALGVNDDQSKKLLQFGSFMAAIIQAKSSDDVESAIEAAALPSGSSRIKRETLFNISLNAYVGLYAGNEVIKGVDENKPFSKFNSYGVAAPIGIAISRGHSILFLGTGKKGWTSQKKGWSTTLFLSIFDLGALTAFRFNNDSTTIKNNNSSDTVTTSQAPSIQLKNILSPGLFLSIGVPKCPLSINFGAQMGPNLRNVSSVNNASTLNFSNNIYWRYSISLCVDIPLLNLYTQSK